MAGLELILLLFAASGVLQVLARQWRVPHPVLLVLGGAALALIPGLPRLELDPELVFVIFVPPLLYRASILTSLREFTAEIWPIARLGVLLVLVSIGAVALVARGLTREFTWAAAFALGAIVAPPDPVAATAVLRPLGAPAALSSILEGEGLVNDATALVMYRVAVAAAVTGTFSPQRAFGYLVLAGVVGVAVGLMAGWAIGRVRRSLRGLPVIENTLSLLTPFIAYLPANRIGASGVLAVVTVGLYLGRKRSRGGDAAARVQAEAMWSIVVFVLESLVFIIVGLELPYAVRALRHHTLPALLSYGLAVSGTLIAVRLLWVWPSAYLPRLITRRRRGDGTRPRRLPPWRWVLFVGWAGMRGAESLVIALALPFTIAAGRPFPARDLIIFITFAVIFATLVLQGLSLGPILRMLHLTGDETLEGEEAHARRVAAEAGLRRLEEVSAADAERPVVRYLRRQQRERVARWSARDRAHHGAADAEHRALAPASGDGAERASERYRALRAEMIAAERSAVIDLRDRGVIGDDALRQVERDLDLETMLLEGADEDAPESPYEAY